MFYSGFIGFIELKYFHCCICSVLIRHIPVFTTADLIPAAGDLMYHDMFSFPIRLSNKKLRRGLLMLLSIVFFVISIIPTTVLFIWLKFRRKDDEQYRKCCNSAFIRGIVSVLPIVAFSFAVHILNVLVFNTVLKDTDRFIYIIVYNFLVLALVEETVKFLVFRSLLKKKCVKTSWADTAAYMVIVGLGFGLIESLTYAIDANAVTMLVRGFTLGHAGYGLIMGFFYGKMLYSGRKRYGIAGFIIPWFIHGLYDFSLAQEFLDISEYAAFLPVALAVLDIVLLVLMIVFFVRSKKKKKYNMQIDSVLNKASGSDEPVEITKTE